MSRLIYIVDTFTAKPFSGNPAAIVLLPPAELDQAPAEDEHFQHVAREMSLAETAFVRPHPSGEQNHFRLRWFTPVREVDLGGHATLAAAQVLYDAAKVNLHTPIIFETRGGRLRAAPVMDYGGFTLDFPATPATETQPPAGLLEALGLSEVRFIGRSKFDFFIEAIDPQSVRLLEPDFERLKTIDARGVIVSAPQRTPDTTRTDEADVVSRCFYPAYGIDEDPVTGSAHCTIGPYFTERLGKSQFVCHQASPRGGELRVQVEQDRVYLTGRAVSVVRGELLV